MCGAADPSAEMRQQQLKNQANISAGLQNIDKAFAGFTPDFYNQRANAYTQFAMPQLSNQYNNMLGNLTYKLAGQGLMGSSAGKQLGQSLEREMGMQKQAIANQGIAQSQQLQQQVGQEKSQLISQLEASADPAASTIQALGAASQFSAPSPYQPLGQAFQNWANIYLGGQLNNAYNQQGNNNWMYYMLANPALHGGGSGVGGSSSYVGG